MTQGIERYAPMDLQVSAAQAETQANSIINQYSGWATALMRVVESKQLFAIVGGKKYLEFEAWQLIGTFDRAHADTDDITPVERGGEIVGWVCKAKIIKDGIRIGGATQMCGLDAYPCRGKEGSAKDNAAISAAQTWAASKAFRMLYSSVATLGGYEAATAEEMKRAQEEAPDKTQHWCETHQAGYFKRGKMRNYAHPVEGSSDWCNEPIIPDAVIPPQPQQVPTAAPAPGIVCPGHDAPMLTSRRTGKVGHVLEDKSVCYGITVEAREMLDRAAEVAEAGMDAEEEATSAGMPASQATDEAGLRAAVATKGIEWDYYERVLLKMPLVEHLRLGGTIAQARAKL